MSEWPRPDKVYFLATADRSMVKIGSSSGPLERLEKCQRWSPIPLELLATAPGSYAEEFALHRYFAPQHSHREWYAASPELLAAIEAIKADGKIPQHLIAKTEGRIPNRRGGRRQTGSVSSIEARTFMPAPSSSEVA